MIQVDLKEEEDGSGNWDHSGLSLPAIVPKEGLPTDSMEPSSTLPAANMWEILAEELVPAGPAHTLVPLIDN